jgi:hypothetical protein
MPEGNYSSPRNNVGLAPRRLWVGSPTTEVVAAMVTEAAVATNAVVVATVMMRDLNCGRSGKTLVGVMGRR